MSQSEVSESRQQIDLDASVDEVWRSLTDPDELAEWLGADVDLDVVTAGAGRITEPDGTVRQVLVTDVDPGRRLAWHWWADGGELSTVEFTLEPLVDATRLRVIETATGAGTPGIRLQASAMVAAFARGTAAACR